MNKDEKPLFPPATREISKMKEALAPETMDAWRNFTRTVFKEGALPE